MVYVDLLVIQDLIYNYVILLGTSLLLTRITNIKKIFLSSVIGTIPLIFIFLKTSNQLNFFISFIFSIIMTLITFSYKDIIYTIKNIFYMYSVSIFLAGGINLINVNLLPNIENYILNVTILIILAPIITYIYIKSINNYKNNYSNYYKVDIYIDEDKKITLSAFLDSVLVEIGFISNPSEENFLCSEDGQTYIASALFRAFRDYKDAFEKEHSDADSDTDTKLIDSSTNRLIDSSTNRPIDSDKDKVIYKVQIESRSRKVDAPAQHYKGLNNVDYYEHNGQYKYTAGKFYTKSEADEYCKKVKTSGYPSAFVVSFKNGKRL